MNANDLADRLEQFYTGTHISKAAEVLRQQQTEIDELRKQLKSACSKLMSINLKAQDK